MRPRDLALAVAVAAIWGFNFVAIHAGLDHFPPLMFNALRFGLAAFPALFFVGRPQVPWRWIIAVALVLGVTKFSLLFAGMNAGMPAGLSSLVLQSQAVFTMLFAVLFLRERPRRLQIAGLTVAVVGVLLVATRMGANLPAFLLVIGAAVAWGLSNVATRKASPPDSLRFMVWVSALATGPLIVLTLLFDGPSADLAALRTINTEALLSLLYIALVSTLAGFAGWGFLMQRYGAATVAPFSMLVPFFGIASAAVVLGEPIYPVDIAGGVLVVGGVLLGLVRARPVASRPLARVGA
ncbi:O-acetylserine/cysteine efflux transporter [Actinoplanes lutulentus]|uniref:O-acetylserine/cysteine efflux transporter n=1 Tax=Actinoplanes lutulentus TaxID=1287878 RepID=A0A327ZFG0_9ACTN|nr:EamA family transporter [Actinoplanes lutulentus]MBB2941583.1 O-acetylserine/cysteine efflux transporter [Actinoplanes lutulentus]RAK39503.1 O-acetylserine/cysteine efflux transporter [Actinoplanes lutulentus]